MEHRFPPEDDEERLIGENNDGLEFSTDDGSSFQRILKPLTQSEANEQLKKYGKNVIIGVKKVTWYSIFFSALFHPFNILLGILAAGSGAMGDIKATTVMIVMVMISLLIRFFHEWESARAAESLKKLVSNKVTVLRHFDTRECDHESISSTTSLITNDSMISTDVTSREILIEDIVPGDWVKLSAGNLIPADILLIESKDFFVSQSSLTGEALPAQKQPSTGLECVTSGTELRVNIPNEDHLIGYHPYQQNPISSKSTFKLRLITFFRNLFGLRVEKLSDVNVSIRAEMENQSLCYMGTSVVSGTATAIVKFTGSRTYFGSMALELSKQRPQNAFQLGVRRISWIFFLTMLCIVPPIFLLQGILHPGDGWYEAALFALAAAVGLTPEMLPMIVSSTLARGAYLMSKKKCIVKNLDSIINLGGMDVLCTDKTGTLTENRVSLLLHLDCRNRTSILPIQLAYLNSHFQTGLSNLLDKAVINYIQKTTSNHRSRRKPTLLSGFTKRDEIPFDFVRRRMSVLLETDTDQNILITKGAVDEMLANCNYFYTGEDRQLDSSDRTIQLARQKLIPFDGILTQPLNEPMKLSLLNLNNELNERGLRVLAVAYKVFSTPPDNLQTSDESELIFAGFIAFEDPPKESTYSAIKTLLEHNIQIKVLTGDSAIVCQKICQNIQLSVPSNGIVTSLDLDGASDSRISELARTGTIFAKLTPLEKSKIVRALKADDHVVGFLGDGINDANALIEADIGLSVDNGTDIARDSADIILLEKDLRVVADGVIYGRQTYGNTLKYIVMAISSNFGNSFSLLIASAWFPFTPILPIQLLTQNLLYDTSQTTIPWDSVDPDFVMIPHRWSMKSVLKFMVCLGPWSSVFDVTFFCYMYFYYGITGQPDDNLSLFRTTWFCIGILTQTFIVHLLRTPKIPFIESRASVQVTLMTFFIIILALSLPWIPYVSTTLEFVHLPLDIYPFILLELVAYCITTQITKIIYIYCFKEWY